ncbi:MAG: hypothetical protein H6Q58_623 [Firmicutes bacterium]|nr:hypothetical protein [Bacillota bacterium]
MRVIIAGGRDFKDYSLLKDKCSSFLNELLRDHSNSSGEY